MQDNLEINHDILVTKKEAAELLKVSCQTIVNYVKHGLLASHRRGNFIYIYKDSIDVFINDSHDFASIKEELDKKKIEYEQLNKEYGFLLEELVRDTSIVNAAYRTKSVFLEALCEMCGSDEFKEKTGLTHRISEIMILWLNGRSFSEISKEYDLSRERIRQLIMTGISCLPKWRNYVQLVRDNKNLIEQCNQLKEENQMLKDVFEKINKKMTTAEERPANKILTMSIHDIGLSNRTVNCLSSSDINTVYDLTRCKIEHLLRIKNLGRKSIYEIETFLNKHNMTLRKK